VFFFKTNGEKFNNSTTGVKRKGEGRGKEEKRKRRREHRNIGTK